MTTSQATSAGRSYCVNGEYETPLKHYHFRVVEGVA